MNRRKFFSNLVVSVGTLVAAYATPITRVSARLIEAKNDSINPDWVNAEYRILFAYQKELMRDGGEWMNPPMGMGETLRSI